MRGRSALIGSVRGEAELGGTVYDPKDPMSKIFFGILAICAEFEVDLQRTRTRERIAIARERGRPRVKQPKLSARQHRHLRELHAGGKYTVVELPSCSRSAVPACIAR